jgi:cell division protein FtsI/penicillin-binding protein 2
VVPRRLLFALALAAGLLSACTGSSGPSPQQKVAAAFLADLGAAHAAAAGGRTDQPAAARSALQADLDGLGATARGRLRVTSVQTAGAKATARFTAAWTLPGTSAPWAYRGTLLLAKHAGAWHVVWRPADVHPALTAGAHLAVQRRQPVRAALLDRTGKALFAKTAVVRVGIEKKLVTNLAELARALAAVPQLQSTRTEITTAVEHAAPTDFVPVVTLRRAVYDQIKARIYNLAGTVFRSDTLLLTPSPQFAQPLLGTVGAATAAIVAKSKGRVRTGDQTGVGGLQQAYDATLAGTAGVSVVAQPDASGSAARLLATVAAPRAGRPVTLTLDRAVQSAADATLASIAKPAALVAVQRSTGRVLADANSSAATYDLGLSGALPPGSTFKMATWTAAFTATPSLTPSSRVPCPGTTTVDGRHFENENKFSHPPVTIRDAFAYSCNTSAIAEAMRLPSTALADAARQLGVGAHWNLPVPAFSGSVPAPLSATERGADAIGQGRVLASPLTLALMAAAVTSGTAYAPALQAGRAPTRVGTLPAGIVADMTTLMKATVQRPGGTGHALAGLGGVEGKTGTAEYGTATPPRSHSWFAGVRGDLAFAVFVYDGASSKISAVPVTKRFLEKLP